MSASFELPVREGVQLLHRTHPLVEGLAAHLLDGALDRDSGSPARRASAVRTRAVATRTTLLVVRHRFQIREEAGGVERVLLAEEVRLAAFRGAPDQAEWLGSPQAEDLLRADPDENIDPELAADFVLRVVEGVQDLLPQLERLGQAYADELLAAHRRVRTAGRRRGVRFSVSHESPPDILGLYVFLPSGT
jgi:hypothetical protein